MGNKMRLFFLHEHCKTLWCVLMSDKTLNSWIGSSEICSRFTKEVDTAKAEWKQGVFERLTGVFEDEN